MSPTIRRGCARAGPTALTPARRATRLEQLGGEAGDLAPLAGREGDVAEAALPPEGLDQHREGVVRLAEVRRVDLARVAGEDHLRALADPGEDRLQRGRLEVLRLVDHDDLTVQAAAAQERHRLQRELVAADQLVGEAGGVVVAGL